jgi:putative membrane protein
MTPHEGKDTTYGHIGRAPAPAASRRFLLRLGLVYGAFWLALAIAPNNRFDWMLENLLVVLGVAVIVGSFRRFPLSRASYLLIAAFLALHAVGAHYTYSETPFGAYFQSALGLDRNHYDRLVHFSFGALLAYPFFDLALRHVRPAAPAWAYLFAFMAVLAGSGLYEIIEWLAARVLEPEDALAFLGTQGDVFDAQKDAALALVGGLGVLVLTAALRARRQL